MRPAIIEQVKQSKFICSACGSSRDCDCAAPALERLAELEEKAAEQREKKRIQKQKVREKAEENNDCVAATEGADRAEARAARGAEHLENEAPAEQEGGDELAPYPAPEIEGIRDEAELLICDDCGG